MARPAIPRDKYNTNNINNNTVARSRQADERLLLLLVPRTKLSRKVTVSLVSGVPAKERNPIVSKRIAVSSMCDAKDCDQVVVKMIISRTKLFNSGFQSQINVFRRTGPNNCQILSINNM